MIEIFSPGSPGRSFRISPEEILESMQSGLGKTRGFFHVWLTGAQQQHWHARCTVPLGEQLRILRVDGLTLEVEPLKGEP